MVDEFGLDNPHKSYFARIFMDMFYGGNVSPATALYLTLMELRNQFIAYPQIEQGFGISISSPGAFPRRCDGYIFLPDESMPIDGLRGRPDLRLIVVRNNRQNRSLILIIHLSPDGGVEQISLLNRNLNIKREGKKKKI